MPLRSRPDARPKTSGRTVPEERGRAARSLCNPPCPRQQFVRAQPVFVPVRYGRGDECVPLLRWHPEDIAGPYPAAQGVVTNTTDGRKRKSSVALGFTSPDSESNPRRQETLEQSATTIEGLGRWPALCARRVGRSSATAGTSRATVDENVIILGCHSAFERHPTTSGCSRCGRRTLRGDRRAHLRPGALDGGRQARALAGVTHRRGSIG